MDALLYQFTFLSDQALQDKNFDPGTIEEQMRLYDLEAYESWAAMEAEQKAVVEESNISMEEAKIYPNSVMESAIDDYRRFEEELDSTSKAELECLVQFGKKEKKKGQSSMKEAEDYFNLAMESAMDEFRRFEQELDHTSKAELESLVRVAKSAKKMGKLVETAATIASKKYMEAALLSAAASMKSAWKGLSFHPNKIHPS